jgi:ribosomal protein S18 acetylase RimI-like enzyme
LRRADWPAVWAILEPVFRAGETYAVARDIGEDAARALWIDAPLAAFVATDAGGAVLGTCYLKPNHAGPGDHVANCGYAVAEAARGQGIASALCAHSQAEAVARGFRAMQYDCVVSTNAGAVRLWQRHGFAIVGTLPGAFRHPRLGEVDACVMFKRLDA